jgi:hypothetical protein
MTAYITDTAVAMLGAQPWVAAFSRDLLIIAKDLASYAIDSAGCTAAAPRPHASWNGKGGVRVRSI